MKVPGARRFQSGLDVFHQYIPDYRPPILAADDFGHEFPEAPKVAEELLEKFRENLQLKKRE